MPFNATGKVDRVVLKKMAEQGAEQVRHLALKQIAFWIG